MSLLLKASTLLPVLASVPYWWLSPETLITKLRFIEGIWEAEAGDLCEFEAILGYIASSQYGVERLMNLALEAILTAFMSLPVIITHTTSKRHVKLLSAVYMS